MRRQSALTAAVCLAALAGLWAPAARAGDEFPYTAEVTRDCEAFAGPGHKYYATDRMAKGAEVEVYARDAATGFLAIRPPAESFSWVPAEHVRVDPANEQVAEVVTPTHSWIGTDVEHIREHKFQVRLPAGELLQVLGRRKIQTGEGQVQTWLKIAPPAGEFRWIAAKSVADPAEEDSQAEDDAADAKIDLAAVKTDEPSDEEVAEVAAASAEEAEESRPHRAVAPAIVLRDLRNDGAEDDAREAVEKVQYASSTAPKTSKPKTTGDGFVPRKPRTLEAGRPTTSPVATSTARARSYSSTRSAERVARLERNSANLSQTSPVLNSSGLISSRDVRRQLDAIDVDLSLMLAQPKETWNLEGLEERVRQLVEKGETAADRGEARLMQEKLEQIAQTFNVSDAPEAAAAVSGYAAVTREAADPRYDGEGWLKPVLSRKRHTAPYALVDSDGKPVCFVTPSPGFRIEGYVNKRVGIYGRRGVIQSLNAQHVLAERVIDLDRQVR